MRITKDDVMDRMDLDSRLANLLDTQVVGREEQLSLSKQSRAVIITKRLDRVHSTLLLQQSLRIASEEVVTEVDSGVDVLRLLTS